MPRLFRAALALFAMLFLFPLTALAAEGPFTIDLAPALGPLGEALVTALSVGVVYLVRRLLTYLGMKEDAQARDVLETAFANGIRAALEQALRHGLNTAKIETRHQLVAEGARYVIAAVPDTLKRFNLDEDAVRARLTARLQGIVSTAIGPVLAPPETEPQP
ncbi:hypothetical protein [Niveispirillum cyanobacteriorum]|uniref:Uncharacterized protein n=1 Tax=Niveispirillum cyanobacteriorum TaxID=1612173 RepID=A0A2K9NDS3_9PROT|nr:hypothetical protein [Niveispirillum cyanobacteriorum]AUN31254.1 hypothetical protein C0V82_14180 [Niveispirillum cyanobacteriorum]GGE72883.1 hypothetical protein GCM10011317_32670 [Niveispirillum cyanobacteriorum]